MLLIKYTDLAGLVGWARGLGWAGHAQPQTQRYLLVHRKRGPAFALLLQSPTFLGGERKSSVGFALL